LHAAAIANADTLGYTGGFGSVSATRIVPGTHGAHPVVLFELFEDDKDVAIKTEYVPLPHSLLFVPSPVAIAPLSRDRPPVSGALYLSWRQ
jgi:hypothetical protein